MAGVAISWRTSECFGIASSQRSSQ